MSCLNIVLVFLIFVSGERELFEYRAGLSYIRTPKWGTG